MTVKINGLYPAVAGRFHVLSKTKVEPWARMKMGTLCVKREKVYSKLPRLSPGKARRSSWKDFQIKWEPKKGGL